MTRLGAAGQQRCERRPGSASAQGISTARPDPSPPMMALPPTAAMRDTGHSPAARQRASSAKRRRSQLLLGSGHSLATPVGTALRQLLRKSRITHESVGLSNHPARAAGANVSRPVRQRLSHRSFPELVPLPAFGLAQFVYRTLDLQVHQLSVSVGIAHHSIPMQADVG